jgi:hypothetical protein
MVMRQRSIYLPGGAPPRPAWYKPAQTFAIGIAVGAYLPSLLQWLAVGVADPGASHVAFFSSVVSGLAVAASAAIEWVARRWNDLKR